MPRDVERMLCVFREQALRNAFGLDTYSKRLCLSSELSDIEHEILLIAVRLLGAVDCFLDAVYWHTFLRDQPVYRADPIWNCPDPIMGMAKKAMDAKLLGNGFNPQP